FPSSAVCFIYVLLSGFLVAGTGCQKKSGAPAPGGLPGEDLSGLTYTDIPGATEQYARQLGPNGEVQIEGFMKDGQKTGMWIQYTPEGDVELINHYVNGQLEGTALRMTFRNQVDLRTHYRQGKLHGPYLAYKFGKVIESRNYEDGMLHGLYQIYDERTFQVKQEMEYKHDKLDGYFRYYNEAGAVTLEYEYKD